MFSYRLDDVPTTRTSKVLVDSIQSGTRFLKINAKIFSMKVSTFCHITEKPQPVKLPLSTLRNLKVTSLHRCNLIQFRLSYTYLKQQLRYFHASSFWHFHIPLFLEIKCQLDATDDFYCRSYCLLNMFREPLCPSSGAREYYTGGCCQWYLVLWFSSCRYGVELRVMCLVCSTPAEGYVSGLLHTIATT